MRKSWDDYFMEIARVVASRSTCNRKQVGAVIIDPESKAIISTGYNGSLPSAPHCTDVGCYIIDGHCTRTVHAETNAINHASKIGARLNGTVLYCTTKPCWNCFKNIIQSGIDKVYYLDDYKDPNSVLYNAWLEERGYPLVRLDS